MEWNTPDLKKWPSKVGLGIGKRLRSNKSFTQEAIRKNEQREAERRRKRAEKMGFVRSSIDSGSTQQDVNELGERDYSVFSQASTLVNNKDHTDMMHRLAHHDSFDSLVDQATTRDKLQSVDESDDLKLAEMMDPRTAMFEKQFAALPEDVWGLIVSYLSPADAASLSLTTRVLYHKLGKDYLHALSEPENRHHKIVFLNHLDHKLPRHLLCFPCGTYHLRTSPGKEVLKADFVANPLYSCPKTRDTVLPRLRLTHGRELPYSFVQLALRREKFSHVHGIDSNSLTRRWNCKDSEWSHRTRFMVHDGRLLMRVVSRTFTLPSKEMTETRERHILYDREEYVPFFSVCAHWRDGELMRLCKCALSHVPSPPQSYIQQLKQAPKISRSLASPNFIVRMCDECRPARRCPECPTEYLIEIQMTEDTKDPVRPFKHAIVVTRWSDLGNGTSPYTNPEWAAIKGLDAGAAEGYDSFSHVGRRAVSGIFESRISGSIPGARMLSLNPKNEKYGEEGHGWY